MGTFYVKTDNHQLTEGIKKLLKDRNMHEGSFPVDFVFLAGAAAYYRNRVNLKGSALSNTIQGPSMDITNKVELHKKFKDKSFILSSDIVPPVPKLSSKFLKILKPFGGFAGEGITTATTKEEIEEWIASHSKYKEWVLQDYIKTPALKNGKKFHLRVHVVITLAPYAVWVCKEMRYYLASEKYTQSDWKNTAIHDTHYTEQEEFFFPDDLPDGWKSGSQEEIALIVATVFDSGKFTPDWNAKNSYYIFGLDIMYNKKSPVLLEVNQKIGLSPKSLNVLIPGVLDILDGKEPDTFVRVL
jgi:hypothetical protein